MDTPEAPRCPLCGLESPTLAHLLAALKGAQWRVSEGKHYSRGEMADVIRSIHALYPDFASGSFDSLTAF